MKPFDYAGQIQSMLDRADPGRALREQMQSTQEMLGRSDPGRALREVLRAQEMLDRVDPGRLLREQMQSTQEMLGRSDPGRALREDVLRAQEVLDRADPGRALWEQVQSAQEMLDRGPDLSREQERLQQMLDMADPSRAFRDRQLSIQRMLSGALLSSFADVSHDSGLESWRQSVVTTAKSLASAYSEFDKQGLDGLTRHIAGSLDWLADIRKSHSPVLEMLGQEMWTGSFSSLRPALVDGFGAELVRHISQATESDSEVAINAFISSFIEWLHGLLDRLPSTSQTRKAILMIVVTVIPMIDARMTSRASEKRILQTVELAEARIKEQCSGTCDLARSVVDKDESHTRPESYFFVTDHLRLRRGPSTHFEIITVLPPNLTVKVDKRENGWASVEFFDFVEGELVQGWVADEYLAEEPE